MVPRNAQKIVWWSAGAGFLVLVALVGAYAAGAKRSLSPGDLASHHARVDLKCAQCHDEGAGVVSLRCERCHDSTGSERLTHASHVLLGSGDNRKADAADELECTRCHVEHRGLQFPVAAVDDRECASCHTEFSSLEDHKEFAIIRAQSTPAVGMEFDHVGHLPKVRDATGGSCEACHVQTPDRRSFQPMTFDRNCAGSSCHTPNGALQRTTGVMAQELIVSPDSLPTNFRGPSPPRLVTTRPGRIRAEQILHKDPWIVANALRLRRSVDPDGDSAERLALTAGISYLEQLQRPAPLHRLPPEQIAAGIQALRAEIAEMDRRLSGSVSPDDQALTELAEATRQIATRLKSVDASAASEVDAVSGTSDQRGNATMGTPADDTQARFERRKSELLNLLDRIAQRGDFKDRAEALKARVQALTVPVQSNQADSSLLVERLAQLDESLRMLRAIPDAGLQAELDRLDLSRRNAVQRLAAGLSSDEFAQRRAELLSLLEAIERRGDETMRYRVASLRQRIIALRPGIGLPELRRARQRRQQDLERLLIEQELQQSARDREEPPAQDASLDTVAIDQRLRKMRSDLLSFERAPRMNLATTSDERQERLDTLQALLEPCEKCHQYDASGVRMAPVRIAEPVMPRSIFNHAPHTTQTSCDTCHASVVSSKRATDVNVPGVENCRSCHGPSRARSECETCHVYHPRSAVTLLRTTP